MGSSFKPFLSLWTTPIKTGHWSHGPLPPVFAASSVRGDVTDRTPCQPRSKSPLPVKAKKIVEGCQPLPCDSPGSVVLLDMASVSYEVASVGQSSVVPPSFSCDEVVMASLSPMNNTRAFMNLVSYLIPAVKVPLVCLRILHRATLS